MSNYLVLFLVEIFFLLCTDKYDKEICDCKMNKYPVYPCQKYFSKLECISHAIIFAELSLHSYVIINECKTQQDSLIRFSWKKNKVVHQRLPSSIHPRSTCVNMLSPKFMKIKGIFPNRKYVFTSFIHISS